MDPIRVVEATVAAYEWDSLTSEAAQVTRRAHRSSLVMAVVASLGTGLAGWALLPRDALVPTLIWTPALGAAVFYAVRPLLVRRGLRAPITRVRRLVVPVLVERIDTEQLVNIVRDGGGLETGSSTVIAVQRREGLVALVATQYDAADLPPMQIPSAGGGP